MEKITSLQNGMIKNAQALREASQRRKDGMTIIDGAREIKRAFEAGIVLDKVLVWNDDIYIGICAYNRRAHSYIKDASAKLV